MTKLDYSVLAVLIPLQVLLNSESPIHPPPLCDIEGLSPAMQGKLLVWCQNGDGQQVDMIEQGFDLNMEAVVKDDDEVLILQEQILLDHNQGIIAPEHVEVIDLNAPPSMDMSFSAASTDKLESVGANSVGDTEMQLVLALQDPPPLINFSVEEIQPEELMTNEQFQA
jgi:hypothetical protein